MNDPVLNHAIRNDADIDRLLLSRVLEHPRPYHEREHFAGKAVLALLARVGNPHRELRCIHIAGSKGKGSVALMCEHLLRDAGIRTGTFTSPHLQAWNERIRIDGRSVATSSLAHTLDLLRPHLLELDRAGNELSPTFFDLITAAALHMFAAYECESVILETGLGGRFDATNVVTPLACCITSIELEHTDKLGNTVSEIAEHKAGIIKSGVPVVTARFTEPAQAVIERCAHMQTAPEWRLGRDWEVHGTPSALNHQRIEYERRARDSIQAQHTHFDLPHAAAHMATNAGLALTLLAIANWPGAASSLSTCKLPARAQVICRQPWIIVDSAHTTASLDALAHTLQQWPAHKRRFVISTTRGKSIHALAALLRDAESVWITRADAQRSSPTEDIATLLEAELPGFTAHIVEQPRAAFERAAADIGEDTLLCICGSVYLAGAALRYWQPQQGC